jgi:hypothetical protein
MPRVPFSSRIPLPAILLAATMAHAAAGAAGPLHVSPVNPRYFTDDSGRAVYLTGSHTWTNLLDGGNGYPPPVFDYEAYLDFLEVRGHNFFRLWTWEQSRWLTALSDDDLWFSPGPPWERTGPGLALDGLPRFDLTQWSQPYFDRLRQRCVEAQARGMYVSVMLFDGFSVAKSKNGVGLQNPWHGHPFRSTNNVNGIDGDTNSDDSGEETHEMGNPAVLALREAYVRKVIDSVNDLDNVLYEISNESHSEATAWQYHMIAVIRAYEAALPEQHPIGMTVEYPDGHNQELFDSDADWISPNGPMDDRPLNDGAKVILADTDHFCGVCGDRAFVWKSFMRGENPIFMDEYDGGPYWENVRWNLGAARGYAERADLIAMTPSTMLSSSGYCLAKSQSPDAEYLVYSEGGGFSLDLTGTAGSLAIEWFSPADGHTEPGGNVAGGAVRVLSPPFGGDAVLYLSQENPVAVEVLGARPQTATLTLANPLRSSTAGTLFLPRAGRVSLSFFDLQGRCVRTLPEFFAPAGSSTLSLLPAAQRSGLFLWDLGLDGRSVARGKVTVIR